MVDAATAYCPNDTSFRVSGMHMLRIADYPLFRGSRGQIDELYTGEVAYMMMHVLRVVRHVLKTAAVRRRRH